LGQLAFRPFLGEDRPQEEENVMRRFALAAGFLLAASVMAQEPELCPCPPPAPPPPLWTGSVGLAYLATSGNSETQSFGLDATLSRQPTPWGVEIRALANRVEDDGETTAERWLAGVRGKRELSERFQLFAGAAYESDEFAGFESRMLVEAGGIWRALTGPAHELDFDAGFTWTDEEPVFLPGYDYFGALAGATYVWNISETTSFRERLVLYPNFDQSDDWRLRSETSLDASLAASWALRVGYLFTRDNAPGPGFEKDDSTFSVSLVWKR
jgi:putative salt-induced outer membrane protein